MRILIIVAMLALTACGDVADCDLEWCTRTCAKVGVCEGDTSEAYQAECIAFCVRDFELKAIAGEFVDSCNGPSYTCEELAEIRN